MVPSKNLSSTYCRKFSTVTGASLGNSSTVKEPWEVSNLTMGVQLSCVKLRAEKLRDSPLGLGHALVPGEIAVRAYVTEAARDKFACYRGRLVGAMLEQDPAVTLQVVGGRRDNRTQAGHSVLAWRQGAARLVPERGVVHGG